MLSLIAFSLLALSLGAVAFHFRRIGLKKPTALYAGGALVAVVAGVYLQPLADLRAARLAAERQHTQDLADAATVTTLSIALGGTENYLRYLEATHGGR